MGGSNPEIEMVVDALEHMDDDHLKRHEDWLIDKFAEVRPNTVIGKRLNGLMRRLGMSA